MPTTTVDSELLRRRALGLRRLSDSMSISEIVDLRTRAGSDVWSGPTATRCHDELTDLGRRVTSAADALILRARSLERRALELEIVAAGAAAH
jgi:hypothetical protein